MVRQIVTISITPQQKDMLNSLARKTGLKVSVLMRQAINMLMGVYNVKATETDALDKVANKGDTVR